MCKNNKSIIQRSQFEPAFLRLIAAILICSIFFIRIFRILNMGFDSDEPQHLHVVWCRINGLVPYKDFFDNHAPLFHFLMMPFLWMFGETATIIIIMRFIQIPLFMALLFIIHLVNKRIFANNAVWITLLTGLFLNFSGVTIEFRPVLLWLLLWYLCIYIILKYPLNFKNGFILGIATGINIAVSLKTVALLVPILLVSCVYYRAFLIKKNIQINMRIIFKYVAAFLIGTLIPVLIVVLIFNRLDACTSMIYCTITHNSPAAVNYKIANRIPYFIIAVLPLIIMNKYLARLPLETAYFTILAYFSGGMLVLYPVVERETIIVFYSMAFIAIVGHIFNRSKVSRPRLFIWVGMIIVATTILVRTPFTNKNDEMVKMYSDIICLTDKTDYIMDAKGENIFRNRPTYYGFELFTKRLMRQGLIPDTIINDCKRTSTHVVLLRYRNKFPPAVKEFFDNEYLEISPDLAVSGKVVAITDKTAKFMIQVPGYYTIKSAENCSVNGFLDGIAYNGKSVYLRQRKHSFVSEDSCPKIVIIWSKALEKGYYPEV